MSNKRVAVSPLRQVRAAKRFVVCINNTDYAASLELRKLYQVIPDAFGEQHGMIRVIDESGEDYLFPQDYFLPVSLPSSVERVLAQIA